MLINLSLYMFYIPYVYCWNYDPKCLFNKCEEEKLQISDFSPYCLVFDCNKEKKSENVEANFKTMWNPLCWFKDCSQQNLVNEQKSFPKFWKYDYWVNENIKNEDSKSWQEKFYCIFKDCPIEVEENVKPPQFSFNDFYKSAVNYLNAAKPQDFIVNNMLSSELNPYCWFTECCNNNTLPGNTKKLSNLFKTHLYGQHLVDTVIDAVGSHWNSGHMPKKALVLSFHGPVGTGKNYASDMIANSLFKLGVKSKYVHHFSGRLHFTLEGNSESYKQNLYGWLKGNVTSCGKQLFIFDEADHMPEQVLNAILPMLDYREKVDGADYRNSIFIFLSNAGSHLILTKLDELYSNNKTRKDVEIEDFEDIIVHNIFNEQGGFYHSDTISHNLIDHYIPFLPMERNHIEGCIMDHFRERNVDKPSEEHVRSILNSISWKRVHRLEYATSGCKSIGSKVSTMYEKYYKPTKEEKRDL